MRSIEGERKMIQFFVRWAIVIVALFVATLLLMATSRLFQLNCFACWKMPLLEIHIYTYNFFVFTLCYEICMIQTISLSFTIVKIPIIFLKSFKQSHIFTMFCLFEIYFHCYFSNSKKILKCPSPKDSMLINNPPSLHH